jgi:hypothetical protein
MLNFARCRESRCDVYSDVTGVEVDDSEWLETREVHHEELFE